MATNDTPKNDPEIAARESEAARQEQGYLAGELIDSLKSIRDSAMDGRDCPEWLAERLQDAEGVLAKADAARFGVTTGNELLAALKKLTGLIRDCHNVFQNHSASWMMQQSAFNNAEALLIENGVAPASTSTGIFCGMCNDTGLQNGLKCPQPGCRKANGLPPFEGNKNQTVMVPRLDMTGMRCQEASQFSHTRYIACSQPATKLVLSERGRRLYPMCEPCADHNIRNRGAKLAAEHEVMDV